MNKRCLKERGHFCPRMGVIPTPWESKPRAPTKMSALLQACAPLIRAVPVGVLVALCLASSQPAAAADGASTVNAAPPFRVLIFSKTLGFRHASITNGIAAIRELGSQNHFGVDATEDSTAFTATNLARYAAVILLSATGDVFNSEQKSALRDYVLNGGGLAGIHGAAFGPLALEDKWTWYGETFCCAFTNHSQVLPARVDLDDPAHACNAGLPAHWQRADEWYNFIGSPRGKAHVLATVDESTYTGGTMGQDHPIAWCRQVGMGRLWYTAMGHTESSYAEPLFRQHLLGGILVAAGQLPAELLPNPRPAPASAPTKVSPPVNAP